MARKSPTKANVSKRGRRPRTAEEKALEAAESVKVSVKKIAGPPGYTEEKAAAVCEQIATGASLRSVCRALGLPESTVRMWAVNDTEGFAARYKAAREAQMEALSEDLVEIADDKSGDHNRDRLRIDTRKWIMARIAPKKYGDRVTNEMVGADGGAVKVDVTGMPDEKLDQLESLLTELTGRPVRPPSSSEGGEGSAQA